VTSTPPTTSSPRPSWSLGAAGTRFRNRPVRGSSASSRKQLANRQRGARRRAALIAKLARAAEPARGEAAVADNTALAGAFNALPPSDREVLGLVAWEELTPREAAAVLGVTPALFSVRLHRARRRLGKRLKSAGHMSTEMRQGGAATDSPDPPAVRMEME
jgi:predicted DNA-binding protein (UPF0251 family)